MLRTENTNLLREFRKGFAEVLDENGVTEDQVRTDLLRRIEALENPYLDGGPAPTAEELDNRAFDPSRPRLPTAMTAALVSASLLAMLEDALRPTIAKILGVSYEDTKVADEAVAVLTAKALHAANGKDSEDTSYSWTNLVLDAFLAVDPAEPFDDDDDYEQGGSQDAVGDPNQDPSVDSFPDTSVDSAA